MNIREITSHLQTALDEGTRLYHLLALLDVPEGYESDFKELIELADNVRSELDDVLNIRS